jgi:hypothetical protein
MYGDAMRRHQTVNHDEQMTIIQKERLIAVVGSGLSANKMETLISDIENYLLEIGSSLKLNKIMGKLVDYARDSQVEYDSGFGVSRRKRAQLQRNSSLIMNSHPNGNFKRNSHQKTVHLAELLGRLRHTDPSWIFDKTYLNKNVKLKTASRKIASWLMQLGLIELTPEERSGKMISRYEKGERDAAVERVAETIRQYYKRWNPGSMIGYPSSHYLSSKAVLKVKKSRYKYVRPKLTVTVDAQSLWKPL